jgi:aryl-alcohol dehydrogenase-like predicted oxidoreductase
VVGRNRQRDSSGPPANDRGLSREHILASIEASVQRLGTDYVDLYQIHRWDKQAPIEETMSTLHEVVRSGKTDAPAHANSLGGIRRSLPG